MKMLRHLPYFVVDLDHYLILRSEYYFESVDVETMDFLPLIQ